LTGDSGPEEFNNKLEIFYGKINDRIFNFYSEHKNNSKLDSPELHGELFERNNNETLIKIDISASFFHILLNIFWGVFAIHMIITIIIPKWQERNIYLNIFILIIAFIFPIMDFGYYFYNLKNMIDDFYLYNEGFYDKYIKQNNEIRPNGT
jgi:hypothetical protein